MTGICYIAPDVEVPYFKGSSTHVLELSRSLVKAGHTVHVIARRGTKSAEPEEVVDGVVFHRVYRGILVPLRSGEVGASTAAEGGRGVIGRAYHVYLNTVFAIYVAIMASRIVESFDLDVIMERETAFGAGAIASIITGKPMFLEMIGPRYSSLSMWRCLKVLAYNRRMVPEKRITKTVFVRAAVNLDLFKPDSESGDRVRRDFGLDGKVTVGYIGSFLDWHGVQDLLDAAEMINHETRRVQFVMVGPHDEKASEAVSSRGLSGSVTLVGPVPYSQVPDYVNACDMLVAPYNIMGTSRSEKGIGSPLKVLEYMACGKPAIGSDLPQVAEIIQDGKTGVLFPAGNPGSLAARILRLADDKDLRRQLGRDALISARESYSWSGLARQIGSTIGEISNVDA